MDQLKVLQNYISDANIMNAMKLKLQSQLLSSMDMAFAFKVFCFAVLFVYVGTLYLRNTGTVRLISHMRDIDMRDVHMREAYLYVTAQKDPHVDVHILSSLCTHENRTLMNQTNKGCPYMVGSVPSRPNPFQAIEYRRAPPRDKVEEWKRNAWTDWMMQLEVDWKEFNLQIEEEKKAWIDEKEADWEQWIRNLQTKWLHFNPNLDSEYNISILEKQENWDERQWKLWISTEGKQLLEQDLKNWFTNIESVYCKWTMNEWHEWKNEKIKEWVTTEWKVNEDSYWSKYDDTMVQTLSPVEKNQWFKWKERIYKEGIEWKNWAAIKESRYVNSNWNYWSEWKNDKRMLFNEWIGAFVDKWIRQKQWYVWVEERKNHTPKETPLGGASTTTNTVDTPATTTTGSATGYTTGTATGSATGYTTGSATGYTTGTATGTADVLPTHITGVPAVVTADDEPTTTTTDAQSKDNNTTTTTIANTPLGENNMSA
ncbi:tryptophan-rich antigen (Pv-fam-a) [Plasmodium ovale wallikeri]|uniref:Tryptophan-rich antigen (Pv-fam-a) n=1 Tax=Plasmodium ovale wallikeri TaxID=864142 RepID=A0A1A9AR78_PLAOA|nr:tryptophan-rich antigen (Pv-fam-a) [Plasmodium ovale wallikeri]